jgi:hypothetical protein
MLGQLGGIVLYCGRGSVEHELHGMRQWQVLERGWSRGHVDVRGLPSRDVLGSERGWIEHDVRRVCGGDVLDGVGGGSEHNVRGVLGRDVLERGGVGVERIVLGMRRGQVLECVGGIGRVNVRDVCGGDVLERWRGGEHRGVLQVRRRQVLDRVWGGEWPDVRCVCCRQVLGGGGRIGREHVLELRCGDLRTCVGCRVQRIVHVVRAGQVLDCRRRKCDGDVRGVCGGDVLRGLRGAGQLSL